MRLLTVGDSFTYGEELVDRQNAWPFLLADKLDCEVTNLAKPGSGNSRMVRYVIENVNLFDLVIIAWSHFARIELADENGFYDLWPGCNYLPHREYSPWRKEVIDYTTRYHNDEYLYNQYIINIILLQTYLTANNKKYIMLDSFYNNTRFARQLAKDNLKKQINPQFYVGWPTQSLMEWTNNTPQGPGGHFLEEGHQIVSEKLNEYIRNLGWVS
jgi:lysophospholipase L1-like esterase